MQLQKVLFLLGKELASEVGPEKFYDFTPYNYGPFDKTVYRDAEDLAERGSVAISAPSGFRRYAPTPEGLAAHEAEIKERAPKRAVAYLEKIGCIGRRGFLFSALVSAIYSRYPEFRANSVFQG